MMKGDWKYQAVGPGIYDLIDDNGTFGTLGFSRGCANLVGLVCDAMNAMRRSAEPGAVDIARVRVEDDPANADAVVVTMFIADVAAMKVTAINRGVHAVNEVKSLANAVNHRFRLMLEFQTKRNGKSRFVEKELYGTGAMAITVVKPAAVGTPLQAIRYALAQMDDERSDVEVEVFLKDWSEGAVGAYGEAYQKFLDATPDEPEHVADDGSVRKDHYGIGRQPIDDIEDAGWGPLFAAGNALKYVRRYGQKNGADDLRKGQWYYNRLNGLCLRKMNPTRVDELLRECAVTILNELDRLLTSEERALLQEGLTVG